MEGENNSEGFTGIDSAAKAKLEKLHFQRELRGLELKAYSGVLEALRASGKPNTEKDGIIKTLRDFFNVSDDRHKAELRVLAYDEKLSLISEKLTGFDFTEEWAFQAQRIYVPLGQQPFSIFRSFPTSFTRTCTTVRDPIPVRKNKTNKYDEDSDVHSEEELELINSIIKDPVCNGWPPEKQRPITIAVDPGTGNEEEIKEIEQQLKKRLKIKKQSNFIPAKSPDITDVPRTPNKFSNTKSDSKASTVAKSRGVKRKESEDGVMPSTEDVEVAPFKKSVERPNRNRMSRSLKSKKTSQLKANTPLLPLVSPPKKSKESSEETSSADEGENGPLPLEESSRVMSPVFSEVIRSSVLNRSKGPRGRSGVDRRKNNALTSPSKTKSGKSRPRTPSQKSGKFKNSIPTSGSRRKSKLNEKLDYDDVLMDLDGNEMENQSVYTSNSEDVPRRLLLDSQSFDRMGDSRATYKEFKSSEDCTIYADSLPIHYNHEDMEQVTDGVFKRPLPPSKGPKPWEIKDARLTHREESVCDENSSSTIQFGEVEVGHQQQAIAEMPITMTNASDTMSSSSPTKHELPPPPKKQRIKSPLIVNPNINPPNVPKVPLSPPVFSTSLSSVNKKRQNSKPISVVDSLNLHLPTSATASSLAASSNNRRPGAATGGGCSMFSNSSALIAGARGTAPGILQQQRKAQPHILANSKVHQRAFLPSMNSGSSISNSVNTNILPPISGNSTLTAGTVPSNAPVSTGAISPHAIQISSSPIPISAISACPPSSTSIPFPNFPGSNTSNLNIAGGGVPMVNRSTTGANIIFVKSNGPGVVSNQPSPANTIPIKSSSRAVILRRAQLPRQVQGNVMILDVQKNQLVTSGQTPPFLQTTRILNAPGELSLLNFQAGASPIKSSPTPLTLPPFSTSDTSPVQTLMSPPQVEKSEGIAIQTANQEPFITSLSGTTQVNHEMNNPVTSSAVIQASQVFEPDGNNIELNDAPQTQEVPQDAEYAQIEAELMQMEEGSFEEVVYEEEVTTEIVPLEDGGNTQYIYTNETCVNAEGETIVVSQDISTHNASSASGSSTDTASETDTSIQHFESPDNDSSRQALIKKVSLSPIDEVKIASDAISRALSLSRSPSPAKRLTFSTPITVGTATFSLSSSKPSIAPECIAVSANSTEISVVPAIFQPATSSTLVMDENSTSTNNICITNSNPAATIALHSNDMLQQCQSQAQENANLS